MIGQEFGGEWTKTKLLILEKYIDAYNIAMKNQKFNFIYIDMFCGSGTNDKNNDVDTSAIISLKYDLFNKYIFNDINEKYVDNLEKLISKEHSDKLSEIEFKIGSADVNIENVINKLGKYDRGIIFLDPYAMNVSWNTVEVISRCKKLDIIYLFPLGALIRTMVNDGYDKEKFSDSIDFCLGTKEWRRICYETNPQVNLFGDNEEYRVNWKGINDYVKNNRLGEIFKVIVSKTLKNNNNSPLFELFLGCNSDSKRACRLASNLMHGVIESI